MTKKKHEGGAGAATRAIEVLSAAGIPFEVHEYEHSPNARAFGEETVEKLGVDPASTFKTLMVRTNEDEYVFGIIPVLAHLSMKLIAKAAGAKSARMADPRTAERRTGYVVGGISPLGQTTPHRLFIDETCLDSETIIVSGGRRGLSVGLSPLDFLEVSGAGLAKLTALE